MLYDQDMPRFLWVETCITVVYIQNRVPHIALGKITPDEVFTRKKLEVRHFNIFGSIAYCHVSDDKCTKLDQSTKN